jgi:hypothetical protein
VSLPLHASTTGRRIATATLLTLSLGLAIVVFSAVTLGACGSDDTDTSSATSAPVTVTDCVAVPNVANPPTDHDAVAVKNLFRVAPPFTFNGMLEVAAEPPTTK